MTATRERDASQGYEVLSSTLVDNETLELQADGEDLDAIVRRLPLTGARRVLDVGCGSGALTRIIARHVDPDVDIVGIDVTPEHVREATARAARAGLPNLRYVVGDVMHGSSGAGGGFDIVCEKYVLMTMLPRDIGRTFVARLKALAAPGGTVALIEADIDFGADRYPPAPEPLATVLPRIVTFYRSRNLIEWQCGPRLFEFLREARLDEPGVTLADGRIIQGGTPRALVDHGNTDVEALIAPCLDDMGASHLTEQVARQWRAYLADENHFVYHPIFVGTGKVRHV